MARKKCNLCKEECAKYLFGMPNFEEIQEDLDKGKIVLGGCCISFPSPEWHCFNCSIDYYTGGFGLWDHSNWLDNKEYNELYEEEDISENEDVSLEHLPTEIQSLLSKFENEYRDTSKEYFRFKKGGYSASETKEIIYINGIIVEYQWQHSGPRMHTDIPSRIAILTKLKQRKIIDFFKTSEWKDTYRNIQVVDGVEWSLRGKIQGTQLNSYGHMVFPKVYDEFILLLQELMEPEIRGFDSLE